MTRSFLLFCVGDDRYALDVAVVERVVPAAEVSPLPDAPETILGLINIAGELMPVVDTRRHLCLPHRDMELSDRLIVTRTAGKPLALLVDKAESVVELSEQAITSVMADFHGSTSAVATLAGRIVLIPDVKAFAPAADPSEGVE
jgi:purine-binding chemotaxis protein CheW